MRSMGASRTDIGLKRDRNEDAVFADDELGLYVVSEGLGGHAAGEVASARAVELLAPEVAASHR